MLRKEYAIDTGGAGLNRGGAGVVKDTCWLTDAEHYAMPLRVKKATGNGAFGGAAGQVGAAWFFEPESKALSDVGSMLPVEDGVYEESTPIAGVLDPTTKALDSSGEYFYFARKSVWRTQAGAVSRYVTNGGGGWGEPKARDPERVMADVRNGYVSLTKAREIYGVAIEGDPDRDPEGLVLNAKATQKLRQ